MDWHTYVIEPIDFCWGFCKSVEETRANIEKAFSDSVTRDNVGESPSVEDFDNAWINAQQLATENHWDGDFKRGPVVFWYPSHTTFEYGFVFRQDEDGVTFVVSPVQLSWLEE